MTIFDDSVFLKNYKGVSTLDFFLSKFRSLKLNKNISFLRRGAVPDNKIEKIRIFALIRGGLFRLIFTVYLPSGLT